MTIKTPRVLFIALVAIVSFMRDGRCATDSTSLVGIIAKAIADRGGNSKENWSGAISGFANLVNSDDQGDLGMKSTAWALWHPVKIFAKQDTIVTDSRFIADAWMRNSQINASITHDPKGNFSYSSGSLGGTYAIFNNTKCDLNGRDFKEILKVLKEKNNILKYVQKYLDKDADATEKRQILDFINKTGHPADALPPNLISGLKNDFNIDAVNLSKSVFVSDSAVNAKVKDIIARKVLWTVSINEKVNFQKAVDNVITVSSHLTLPVSIGKPTPFDLSASFTIAKDTTKTSTKFGDRQKLNFDLGHNWQPISFFEWKFAAGFAKTLQGVYKTEKDFTVSVATTPSLKITDHLWLPVMLKYDVKNAQFFGFLSLQYYLL